MPLYLVRWPDLSAALVTAEDDDHLRDILDEVADPSSCTWTIYTGPLFVEFSLPAKYEVKRPKSREDKPVRPEDIVVGDVSELYGYGLKVSAPDCDTADEMFDAIEADAFPNVHEAREALLEDESGQSDDLLRKAVAADLGPTIRASRQRAPDVPMDVLRRGIDAAMAPLTGIPDPRSPRAKTKAAKPEKKPRMK